MSDKLNISNYENGLELLVENLKLPPAPDGSEQTMQQKKMFILQFLTLALMS